LANIPQFYDAVSIKPEDMDKGHAPIAGLVLYNPMQHNKISLGDHALHFKRFVRVLARIFLHLRLRFSF
jgi:hypothetical protein